MTDTTDPRGSREPLGGVRGHPEPRAADVAIPAADHLGRPADDVEAALAALGLRVQRETVERSDVPAGSVLALGPVGALAPGDLVTLVVAVAPPAPAPVVATAPAPAPVVVDDADDGSEPGRSEDRGRGRGRQEPGDRGGGNGRG